MNILRKKIQAISIVYMNVFQSEEHVYKSTLLDIVGVRKYRDN